MQFFLGEKKKKKGWKFKRLAPHQLDKIYYFYFHTQPCAQSFVAAEGWKKQSWHRSKGEKINLTQYLPQVRKSLESEFCTAPQEGQVPPTQPTVYCLSIRPLTFSCMQICELILLNWLCKSWGFIQLINAFSVDFGDFVQKREHRQ